MSELYTDTLRSRCQDAIWKQLQNNARFTLQLMLNDFLQVERDQFLGCLPYQRASTRKGYRNGAEDRLFDTPFGTITLRMPRVRNTEDPFRPLAVQLYQRRHHHINRIIVELVARGLSTRQTARALHSSFGAVVSAQTVSNVVARIDLLVRHFHRRDLERGYRWLHLDAKHTYISHKRKRHARGKKKKAVVLIAWGVRHNGQAELVDYRIADKENADNWTDFLSDLEARGLREHDRNYRPLEMIVTDGDMGLLQALAMVWPRVPKQRCIFHKVQNIAGHLRDRSRREAILCEAAAVYHVQTPDRARYRLRRWARKWRELEPAAVRNFDFDFDSTLIYLNAAPQHRRRLGTNNPIERLIKEINRKINQAGVYPNQASLERAVYLTWQRLQADGYPRTRTDEENLFTRNS